MGRKRGERRGWGGGVLRWGEGEEGSDSWGQFGCELDPSGSDMTVWLLFLDFPFYSV